MEKSGEIDEKEVMYIKLKFTPKEWKILRIVADEAEYKSKEFRNDVGRKEWRRIMKDIREKKLTVEGVERLLTEITIHYYVY